MPIIATNLSFKYNPKAPFAKHALCGIDLAIADGEYFGIIGHTGSGKSTLIQHFNALIKLQGGELTVDEFNLAKKYDYKQLRSRVGMVFQYPEYQLFDETVEKDVGFGPRNLGLSKEEIARRVERAIRLVGLDYEDIKDRSPFDLSGGQKRRVALAGVIAMEPKTLILDEPTAGLDPRGKQEILELIRTIKETSSPTIIMISHNMDEIAECCTKIAVLNTGRVEMVLPPEQLFSQAERLAELGLGIPSAARLAMNLRSRGIDIPDTVCRESELIRELDRLFIKGGAQ